MDIKTALIILDISMSDLESDVVIKKKTRTALKKSHPDLPTGSQDKFLKCQEAIKALNIYLENKKDPVAYKNPDLNKEYKPTGKKSPWQKRAVHGEHFSDIHVY